MIQCIRTDSENKDFRQLVQLLDADLRKRDGDENLFYSQFNKIDAIQHVVVVYMNNTAIGCGAIKAFSKESMEIKRMYVVENMRGRRIGSVILQELERWAFEMGYRSCVLETGKRQVEALALYKSARYRIIPNYGQYEHIENSVCFEKILYVI